MARLLRKRKTGIKKRKKSTPVGSESSQEIKVVEKNSTPTAPKKVLPLVSGAAKQRKNYLDITTQFLREVMVELKKVTWPSRKQTTGSTIVMIILVAIISLFLGIIDIGLSKLIQTIFQ